MRSSVLGAIVLLLAIAATGLVGCGPAIGTISGTVTIDGKPLDKGSIQFSAAEGNAPPATGKIENGSYSVRTNLGKKRVQISAPKFKQVPKMKGSQEMMEIPEGDRLPAKYNIKSELTFDVGRGGASKNWETTTK